MDLQEPTKKMSKSFGSEQGKVLLLDEPDATRGKIKRAVADSGREDGSGTTSTRSRASRTSSS